MGNAKHEVVIRSLFRGCRPSNANGCEASAILTLQGHVVLRRECGNAVRPDSDSHFLLNSWQNEGCRVRELATASVLGKRLRNVAYGPPSILLIWSGDIPTFWRLVERLLKRGFKWDVLSICLLSVFVGLVDLREV